MNCNNRDLDTQIWPPNSSPRLRARRRNRAGPSRTHFPRRRRGEVYPRLRVLPAWRTSRGQRVTTTKRPQQLLAPQDRRREELELITASTSRTSQVLRRCPKEPRVWWYLHRPYPRPEEVAGLARWADMRILDDPSPDYWGKSQATRRSSFPWPRILLTIYCRPR